MQAILRSGNPVMIDHAPVGAISAGDVVVIGDKCYIAHNDIAAGALGALAAHGGIYEVLANGGSGGDEIDKGAILYWDDGANEATETGTSNTPLGYAAADKEETDETILVEHISL